MRLDEIWRWKGPVLAREAEDVVGPGGLYDADRFLENLPIDLVLHIAPFGQIRRGRARTRYRSVGLKPAGLVATGEADIEPALQHVIERRDLFSYAHRVVGRQHVPQRVGLQPFRVQPDEQARHPRMIGLLEAFDLQVVLVMAVPSVSELVGR